jgi:hypothetical protein
MQQMREQQSMQRQQPVQHSDVAVCQQQLTGPSALAEPQQVAWLQHTPDVPHHQVLDPAAAELAAVLSAAGVSGAAAAAAAAHAAAAPTTAAATHDVRGCSDDCHAAALQGQAAYPAGLLGDSSSRCASPTPDYLQQLFDQTISEHPAHPAVGTTQDSAGQRMQHTTPEAGAAADAGGRLLHTAQGQPPTPGPAGWGDLAGQQAAGRGRVRTGISRFGAEEERHKQKKVS